jgi:tape measure domain-containing protein
MGAQTDVKLVIKAQDEATKALGAITGAIQNLVGAQDGLVKGSGATASLLDQLRAAGTSLAGAFDIIDNSLARAQQAFDRQAATLAETKDQLAAVTAQMGAAEAAVARLNAQFGAGPQLENFHTKLNLATVAQKELTAQASQLTRTITLQESALARAGGALQSMQSANRVAGSAAILAGSGTPQAVTENAAETARATQINQAFEIMALEAADAAEKEAAGMRNAAVSAGQFARTLPPIAPAAQEANASVRGLWTTVKELVSALFTVPGAEARAESSLTTFGTSSRAAFTLTQRFRAEVFSLVQTFFGLYAAVGAVQKVLSAYQALQSAENKLGVVFSQNQNQVSAELDFLREQAIRLGLSFTDLADQYATFAISAQSAGFSLDNTRKLFLSIVDASRVLHLSTADVNRVLLAFTEMLSKGEVQSTQLRKQLGTDLPGAVQLFADALGVSTEKLDGLMKRGEIFADSETLTAVADRLNAKYGAQLPQALETAQTQIGRFQALLQQAEIQVGQGGFIDQLNAGLTQLNGYLRTDDARQFFAGIGSALGKMVGFIPSLVRNFDLVTTGFKAWIALRISGFFLDLITKMGSVATAARAMWAAVGGVPGLIVAGVSFALESVLEDWLTSVDKATAALEAHQRLLNAVKNGYEAAGGAVDNWAKKIKGATEVEAIANLQKLQAALAQVKIQIPTIPLDRAQTDSAISAKTGIVGATIPDALTTQLDNIIQKFKDGKTSYDAFKKDLSDFGVAHPQFQDFIVQVLDSAKNFGDLQTSIKQAGAALDVLRGKATSTDLKTLGLDSASGWTEATNAADKYGDALEKLSNLTPDQKRQNQFSDNLQKAATDYQAAIKAAVSGLGAQDGSTDAVVRAATTAAKLVEAKQIYDQVVEKIHAYAAADQAKNFPLDNKAIIERIIYVESNGSVTAKNPDSSAFGIGQFTNATWLQIFDQIRPALADLSDSAKLSLRSNDTIAREALDLLTKQNQLALADAGIPTTAANTYLAHFLGAAGAIKMILANPDELASKIAGAAATKANPKILGGGATAGDVLNFAQTKMGGASPITSTGATELENFTAALQEQMAAWTAEAKAIAEARGETDQQANATARALTVQKAVDEWTKRAISDHTALSDTDKKAIEATVAALYDQEHAAQAAQKAVDSVVGLSEQRATAIQELQNAFKDGSSTQTVDALKQKIADLTQQILNALPATRAMVNAFGDPKMVESLDKVNLQLKTLKTGLTDAKEMNVKLADGLTDAWGNFLQTLGQSGKILVNLRTAFLQFVQDFLLDADKMILKQDLLNALSGTGIGDFLSKAINGATGTDGAGGAALATAGTTLTTAGAALNEAAIALNGAAIALAAGGVSNGFGGGALSALQSAAMFASTALHSGGIAGVDGTSRTVAASIFAGARRFHSGGLPGLRRNEVATILERGEEVLTRNDPRHVMNGGAGAAPSVKLTNVNVFDPADAFAAGLNSTVGGRTLFNFVRNNKAAMNAALA